MVCCNQIRCNAIKWNAVLSDICLRRRALRSRWRKWRTRLGVLLHAPASAGNAFQCGTMQRNAIRCHARQCDGMQRCSAMLRRRMQGCALLPQHASNMMWALATAKLGRASGSSCCRRREKVSAERCCSFSEEICFRRDATRASRQAR